MKSAVAFRPTPLTHASVERSLFETHAGRSYQIVRELGRGGMGIVFLARDVTLHRLVAIKVMRHELSSSAEECERFRREARIAAQLRHDGIVAVHGFGEADGLLYMVMEFIRGEPLAARLARTGRMDPAEAREILVSLAETLEYAHTEGIVHRDLKPENIVLDRESGRPMLTDFGVALSRSRDPVRGESSRAFGTPHFMSPEQAAGELDLDGRSDVYSLGVLGYLMLTGEPPFSAPHFAAIASKHINEAHVPVRERVAGVPADLAVAVDRCLEKLPERRFESASNFAAALVNRRNRPHSRNWVSAALRSAVLIASAFGLAGGPG